MKHKTCVSIAEKTPARIKRALDLALSKSDYAEIRLDHVKSIQIPDALELVKKRLGRTVCTIRPKSEGGAFSGTEKERVSILKLASEYDPFLLDVELDTLKKNPGLASYLKGADLLVSWHDFEKTPGSAELGRKMSQIAKFSSNIKMACTARTANDATRMLELYSKRGRNSLISFAMGDQGRFSRILCLYLGSPYTYVSLGRPVAPGQFSVDEVRRIAGLRV
ncbi:MAG: type I 3-dehydroquinate dehydratase [Nitrosopumilus sp. H8]|nr:MAG: type I 3-dehydroquinate dehydratase [Nitrosopumilus sp. H13]RNJ78614.1 MAG: type I 3-dehydroquinate dehydratase [Nitrosopumilus sp. H8]